MLKVDPAPGKVIMDIGCNKGQDAVQWLERWDPSPHGFWNMTAWMHYMIGHRLIKLLPKLNVSLYFPCPLSPPKAKASQFHPARGGARNTVVCVEPMQATVKALRATAAALGYDSTAKSGSLHIIQAAVADEAFAKEKNFTIHFPDARPGVETNSLGLEKLGGPSVPLTTADGIARDLNLSKVDILTIDTEGWDPAVLDGARSTLESVRFLQFEVLRRPSAGTPWSNTTLRSVIDGLSDKFECFWAGNNGKLMSITRCWRPRFEGFFWSNVVCARRGDPWEKVLQEHAGIDTKS